MLNERLGLGMAGSGAMPVINENVISGRGFSRQNTHYMMLYMPFFYKAFSYWSRRPDSPTPDCKGCRKARPPDGGPERKDAEPWKAGDDLALAAGFIQGTIW